MLNKVLVILAGVVGGMFLAYFLINNTKILSYNVDPNLISNIIKPKKTPEPKNSKKVIGFLPFWLIDRAQDDYSPFITQLSYFNVVIDSDGTIQKFTAPGESDPGWHALFTGKIDNYIEAARQKGLQLSLTVFSGNDAKINKFLDDPVQSAQNLVAEISPILKQYGFTDLNLDIEKVSDASPDDREKYKIFVSEVRKNLDKNISITVDAPPIAFVKDKNLVDPKMIGEIANYVVLMGYDYHNPGSFVTGPVSPQSGAGIISEFDIESAVQTANTVVPKDKLILAIPLYGYSWETINSLPRSGVMPGSGFSISSRNVSELLENCATCSGEFDKTDFESRVIYKDTDSGLYHQIFYPDALSTQIKVDFAKSEGLAGMAVWALGYEDGRILEPLKDYLKR